MPLFLAAKRTVADRAAAGADAVPAGAPLAAGLRPADAPPRDNALTRRWITPALTDRRIRADIARFARGVDRTALVDGRAAAA